jgi:UDP-N-acetylglucosamine:LPS N-acetylglucosamine transferase
MKKIIIFSSMGGGGHTAVANALQEYLKDDYSIEIVNIFTDVIRPLNTIFNFSPQKITGEDIYNYSISHKWYGFLNLYFKIGAMYFKIRHSQVEERISKFIDQKNPDLIISVVPLVNNNILEIAQKRNIPFLLIPTDLDISTFIFDINCPSYDKFKISLAFNDILIQQKINQAQIPRSAIIKTGFILRPDFFEKKDIKTLKKIYNVPEGKPVILLLLGGVGLKALYTFAQHLAQVPQQAHLLLCIGRQAALKEKIKTIPFPDYITTTTISFTDRISDLMAISNFLITKSGSVSVCEAIYTNLPLILDATSSSLLRWEQYNHSFIKEHNFGTVIDNIEKLPSLINELLSDSSNLSAYKYNLAQFEKKHGGNEIKQVIKEILET